ncbi:MAG: hypothetical protein Q9196_006946 [Gyalolechia fulgens]
MRREAYHHFFTERDRTLCMHAIAEALTHEYDDVEPKEHSRKVILIAKCQLLGAAFHHYIQLDFALTKCRARAYDSIVCLRGDLSSPPSPQELDTLDDARYLCEEMTQRILKEHPRVRFQVVGQSSDGLQRIWTMRMTDAWFKATVLMKKHELSVKATAFRERLDAFLKPRSTIETTWHEVQEGRYAKVRRLSVIGPEITRVTTYSWQAYNHLRSGNRIFCQANLCDVRRHRLANPPHRDLVWKAIHDGKCTLLQATFYTNRYIRWELEELPGRAALAGVCLGMQQLYSQQDLDEMSSLCREMYQRIDGEKPTEAWQEAEPAINVTRPVWTVRMTDEWLKFTDEVDDVDDVDEEDEEDEEDDEDDEDEGYEVA